MFPFIQNSTHLSPCWIPNICSINTNAMGKGLVFVCKALCILCQQKMHQPFDADVGCDEGRTEIRKERHRESQYVEQGQGW